jgi:hypothetical protein
VTDEHSSLDVLVESHDQQQSLRGFLSERHYKLGAIDGGIRLTGSDPGQNATIVALVETWRSAYPNAEVTLRQGTSETILRTEI